MEKRQLYQLKFLASRLSKEEPCSETVTRLCSIVQVFHFELEKRMNMTGETYYKRNPPEHIEKTQPRYKHSHMQVISDRRCVRV